MARKLILIIFCCFLKGKNGTIWLDPDTGLSLYQYLDQHGYSFYENHTLTTEDGYILRTVRIPRGKSESETSNSTKPAVLLLHGIFSNPVDFIFKDNSSIGFLLAEEGFDVFLMASRENTYSLGHKTLDRNSVEFWNFSFHEIGYYDIPANVDYITNLTGNQNLSFIGHSQGGTCFTIFAAARPEYRSKFTMAHLFAPVVYMSDVRLPFFDILKDNPELIDEVTTNLELKKGVLTYSPIFKWVAIMFCNRDSPLIDLCVALLGILGPNPAQIPKARITVMASNDPAGGAFKSVIHFSQIAKSGEFRQYDYRSKNSLAYNQTQPPNYDLGSINDLPMYVWYGLNDYFSGPSDYRRVISEIPSAIGKRVPNPLWNHIDFLYAKDAASTVYNEAIDIMKKAL